jgi:hypothetical protein
MVSASSKRLNVQLRKSLVGICDLVTVRRRVRAVCRMGLAARRPDRKGCPVSAISAKDSLHSLPLLLKHALQAFQGLTSLSFSTPGGLLRLTRGIALRALGIAAGSAGAALAAGLTGSFIGTLRPSARLVRLLLLAALPWCAQLGRQPTIVECATCWLPATLACLVGWLSRRCGDLTWRCGNSAGSRLGGSDLDLDRWKLRDADSCRAYLDIERGDAGDLDSRLRTGETAGWNLGYPEPCYIYLHVRQGRIRQIQSYLPDLHVYL